MPTPTVVEFDAIYSRSPYFVSIDEPLQTTARLRVWLWNASDVEPVTTTYLREKSIASPQITEISFNLSNLINEFYELNMINYNFNVTNETNPPEQFVYVKYELAYRIGAGAYEVIESRYKRAFYGYGYFNEQYNPLLSWIHLTGDADGTSPTMYYWNPQDSSEWPTIIAGNQASLHRAGSIRVINTPNLSVKYTNIKTGANVSVNIPYQNKVIRIPLVYGPYWNDGNYIDIRVSGIAIKQWKYLPLTECKYEVVVCDFINKFGAWQRTFFYKASRNQIDVKGQEYELMTENINYDTDIAVVKTFNVNAVDTISCNTGWVDENFSIVLKELLLSETIKINGESAKLITKKTEFYKSLNQKMINYKLDFAYAFDTINNIV
jgi:hypothetical protein